MNKNQEPDVGELAAQIEKYLCDKHHAADTLEGLTRWWIMRQKIEEEEIKVKRAVAFLLESGKLKKRVLPDGTEILSGTRQDS